MEKARAQRRRSVLIQTSLSAGEVSGGRGGRGTGRTFDVEGGDVAAGFHYAAEEDGHIGDLAVLEDGRVLLRQY